MGCKLLIKEGMQALTDSERRLAEFLLEHSSEVVRMNVKSFAEACGASPATVVRFSKKLGFEGFTDLKLDLAGEAGQVENDEFQMAIRDNDDMEAIVRKAERIHLQNMTRTCRMVNVQALSQTVQELCRKKRIHLLGVGESGLLAMDFLYKASRIGIPCFYHTDPHANIAAAALLGPDDAAIAISYSGETRETVMAAKTAKEHGAMLVAITQANYNTIGRMADFPLFIPSEEGEFRVGAMTSRTSTLLILDLLYLGLAKDNPGRTESNLRETQDAVRRMQKQVQ